MGVATSAERIATGTAPVARLAFAQARRIACGCALRLCRGVLRSPCDGRGEPVEPRGTRQDLVLPLPFGEDVRVSFAVCRGGFLVRTVFRVRVVGAHVVMLPRFCRFHIMLTLH